MNIIRNALATVRKGKRAVSPVVAAILLIGLTVASGAIVFFIVLPMFEGAPDLMVVEDSTYVKYLEGNGTHGWAEAGIMVVNKGNAGAKIKTEPAVKFRLSGTGSFALAIDPSNVTTEDGIDSSQPLEIPAAADQLIKIYFLLPALNIDDSVDYQFTIEYSEGTIQVRKGSGGKDLTLSKDRPEIDLLVDSYIRRTYNIAPAVSDNDEIKNVTIYIYNNVSNAEIANYSITTSPWAWSWNTYPLIANPGINIKAEVWDYANLNDTSWAYDIQLDNDYIQPEIIDWDTYNATGDPTGKVVELGESTLVKASVTDSGCLDSRVSAVFLYYKISDINDTQFINNSISMSRIGVSDTWQGNIPSSIVNLAAFAKNMTCWIKAIDRDGNTNSSADKPGPQWVDVEDTKSPNIDHTPLTSAYYRDAIEINATIADPGGAIGYLWYRTANDTEFASAPVSSWFDEIMTNTSGVYSFTIPASDAVLDGIDYFINSTDITANNTAWDGNEASPYHIKIVDDWTPYVYQSANVTAGVTGVDLQINALVYDNDRSFANDSGLHTGNLTLFHQQGITGSFTPVYMTPESYTATGYTPLGFKITRWVAYIPGELLTPAQTTYYYLEAKDRAFNWPTLGYNNTHSWGTDGNPIVITVSDPSNPTITRSSTVKLSADGKVVTFSITISGSTCYANELKVYWGNGSTTLTDVWIGGSSTWPGGSAANNTWSNITPDKYLGIAEYEVRLYFSSSVYQTKIGVVFNTTYGASSYKVQDPITFTTPEQGQTTPTFTIVAALPDGNREFYVQIRNDGAAATITRIYLSGTGTDFYKELQRIQMGLTYPPQTNVWSGSDYDFGSPYDWDIYISSFAVPGSGGTFFIRFRFNRNQNDGTWDSLQLYVGATIYTVSGTPFTT